MKNYILILLSVLGVSFLLNSIVSVQPDFLTEIASDTVSAKSLTIPTTESYLESDIEDITSVHTNTNSASGFTARIANSTVTAPNYTITYVGSNVTKNPYNNIIRVNKLIYGHNSYNLLGTALNLGSGSIFTVTENGVTTTYKVVTTALFKKLDDYTLSLCSGNNYENCNSGIYYMDGLRNAYFQGQNYGVALFTCDGTSLGGGDASHRKVVFAYQI